MERADNKLKGKKRTKLKLKSGDFWLMLFTLMLVLFGLIMVFSASYYSSISQDGNPYGYLVRHGAWVVFGLVAMAFGALFDYRKYKKWALPILIISVILLVLVLTPLGQTTNGATRWIKVGPVTLMPGEIAKIAAIIFVAWFLSEDASRIKSLKRGILPLLGIIAVYGALIVKQPRSVHCHNGVRHNNRHDAGSRTEMEICGHGRRDRRSRDTQHSDLHEGHILVQQTYELYRSVPGCAG